MYLRRHGGPQYYSQLPARGLVYTLGPVLKTTSTQRPPVLSDLSCNIWSLLFRAPTPLSRPNISEIFGPGEDLFLKYSSRICNIQSPEKDTLFHLPTSPSTGWSMANNNSWSVIKIASLQKTFDWDSMIKSKLFRL